MTALDVLKRCRSGEEEIRWLEDSISLRRMTLDRCTQQITGMPGGGGVQDTLASMVCEIADLEKEVELRRKEYAAELCAGTWIVDKLPRPERTIVRGWFIEHKSLACIALESSYSISSVKRLRASGIERCQGIGERELAGFFPEWYTEKGMSDLENS